MDGIWLFVFLGILGSAGPGHFGFRILAYRHHLDRGYPFSSGSEDGSWGYSGWLMTFKFRHFNDRSMRVFAGNAAVMGWLALISAAACVYLISRESF
jgi:hypothetical protein